MTLKERAKNIRSRIIKTAYEQQLSHVGSCLSCIEILTVLFFKIMKPKDIFIMSPGHKALAYYSVLVEKGILKDIDMKKLGGHTTKNKELGIVCSTGSLGMGLPVACGLALAGKRVYCLLSDGDIEEGSTWEAVNFAYRQHLDKLTAIVDCNHWTAYKETYTNAVQAIDSWKWVDGHRFSELKQVLRERRFVFAETIKGKGLKRFENKLGSHYWKVTREDFENYCRS